MGNQNPYIEEEQTTQWPKKKYKRTSSVSDLRRVGGFLGVLRVSSNNKNDNHVTTEILLKVTLNTINHKPNIKLVLFSIILAATIYIM
jgi:hypothetical protein